MNLQAMRAQTFNSLHERSGIFVIPNSWDAGSTKMLEISTGFAFSVTKLDQKGSLDREETLGNVQAIINAILLPVSAMGLVMNQRYVVRLFYWLLKLN